MQFKKPTIHTRQSKVGLTQQIHQVQHALERNRKEFQKLQQQLDELQSAQRAQEEEEAQDKEEPEQQNNNIPKQYIEINVPTSTSLSIHNQRYYPENQNLSPPKSPSNCSDVSLSSRRSTSSRYSNTSTSNRSMTSTSRRANTRKANDGRHSYIRDLDSPGVGTYNIMSQTFGKNKNSGWSMSKGARKTAYIPKNDSPGVGAYDVHRKLRVKGGDIGDTYRQFEWS